MIEVINQDTGDSGKLSDKETLRVAIISLSKRLGIVIQQGLSRFQVEFQTYNRVDQGLKLILSAPPHVVLIEDNMQSAYAGAAAIHQRLPQTGVIMISRVMTREKVMQAAKAGVTRVIVRPFALTTLLGQIRDACNVAGNDGGLLVPTAEAVIDLLRDVPDGKEVLAQLRRIESLQAVPHVVHRVMAITSDEGSGANELERVVQGDANIAAIVLKRANSSHYAAVNKITRVRDAITRIGFDNVRGIVMALSLMNLTGRESKQVGFDREEFWKASLATAVLAREFAAHFGVPKVEEAFIIGLLADFGCMVLDEHMPLRLEKSICLAQQELLPLGLAEQRVMGITHAQVGAFILNRWRFPGNLINILGGQQADKSTSELTIPDRMLRTAVWLARWTVTGLGLGDKAEVVLHQAPRSLTRGLSIADLLTNDFLSRVIDEVNKILEFFEVQIDWPGHVSQDQPPIYIYQEEQPQISPLELVVRRLGAQPVRLEELQELEQLESGVTAIVSMESPKDLKQAAEGKNWGEKDWLFVLPRGGIPVDDSVKQRVGLPTGVCSYAEFPLVLSDLVSSLAKLEARHSK